MKRNLKKLKAKITEEKEWMDDNEKPFPPSVLKRQVVKWDRETWRKYLKSIERSSTELPTQNYDEILKKNSEQESLDQYLSDPDGERDQKISFLHGKVKEAVFELPYLELCIIRGIFYDRRSTREVAKTLRLSRSYVMKLRDQALIKIRNSVIKLGS